MRDASIAACNVLKEIKVGGGGGGGGAGGG